MAAGACPWRTVLRCVQVHACQPTNPPACPAFVCASAAAPAWLDNILCHLLHFSGSLHGGVRLCLKPRCASPITPQRLMGGDWGDTLHDLVVEAARERCAARGSSGSSGSGSSDGSGTQQQGASSGREGVIEGLTRRLLEQMQREALAELQTKTQGPQGLGQQQEQPGGTLAGGQLQQPEQQMPEPGLAQTPQGGGQAQGGAAVAQAAGQATAQPGVLVSDATPVHVQLVVRGPAGEEGSSGGEERVAVVLQVQGQEQEQAQQVLQTDAQGSDAMGVGAGDRTHVEAQSSQQGAAAAADAGTSAGTAGSGSGHRLQAPTEPGTHPQEQRDGLLWFPKWGCWVHEQVCVQLSRCSYVFDRLVRTRGAPAVLTMVAHGGAVNVLAAAAGM